MDIVSTQKFLRMSPRKLRVVARLVKDMSPLASVELLPFMGRRAATPIQKVVKSALANARVKGANEANLVFKEIQINEGPRLKRFRAGSRGRAKPYTRDLAHIRVVLTDEKGKATKAVEKQTPVVEKVEEKVLKASVKKGKNNGTKS